jgi:hypothetical protein
VGGELFVGGIHSGGEVVRKHSETRPYQCLALTYPIATSSLENRFLDWLTVEAL